MMVMLHLKYSHGIDIIRGHFRVPDVITYRVYKNLPLHKFTKPTISNTYFSVFYIKFNIKILTNINILFIFLYKNCIYKIIVYIELIYNVTKHPE